MIVFSGCRLTVKDNSDKDHLTKDDTDKDNTDRDNKEKDVTISKIQKGEIDLDTEVTFDAVVTGVVHNKKKRLTKKPASRGYMFQS